MFGIHTTTICRQGISLVNSFGSFSIALVNCSFLFIPIFYYLSSNPVAGVPPSQHLWHPYQNRLPLRHLRGRFRSTTFCTLFVMWSNPRGLDVVYQSYSCSLVLLFGICTRARCCQGCKASPWLVPLVHLPDAFVFSRRHGLVEVHQSHPGSFR